MTTPAATAPSTLGPNAPPAPPPPGFSRGILVGIAVVVAIALVVAAIFVFGLGSSSGSPTTAVSSSSALASAASVASEYHLGELYLVVGISMPYSYVLPNVTGNVSCPLAHAYDKNITIPAESGSYSSGNAAAWYLLYESSSPVSESVVVVVGATVYYLGTVSGAGCVDDLALTPVPTDAVSSAVAATSADSDAGSYLSAHAESTAVYVLTANGSVAVWDIVYTNCSYDPSTGVTSGGTAGDLFVANITATTGAVVDDANENDVNCSALLGGISIGSPTYSLAMERVGSLDVSSTFYDILALSPTAGLSTADFGILVVDASSTALPGGAVSSGCVYGGSTSDCLAPASGWYAVLTGSSGTIIATYSADGAGWANFASATTSVTLTGAMELWVVSTDQLEGNGYVLSVFSTGSTSVSGSVEL